MKRNIGKDEVRSWPHGVLCCVFANLQTCKSRWGPFILPPVNTHKPPTSGAAVAQPPPESIKHKACMKPLPWGCGLVAGSEEAARLVRLQRWGALGLKKAPGPGVVCIKGPMLGPSSRAGTRKGHRPKTVCGHSVPLLSQKCVKRGKLVFKLPHVSWEVFPTCQRLPLKWQNRGRNR